MQGPAIQMEDYFKALTGHASTQGFDIHTYGTCDGLPLIGLTRTAETKSAPCIYLCAGIHGDEPAGPLALLELIEEGALVRDIQWVLCPAMNPIGLKHGSRYAHCGEDLNRDYKHGAAYETKQHMAWLKEHCSLFNLHISLHEDWEAQGFYLYAFKPEGFPNLTPAMLEAASKHCPIETAETIDSFPAQGGVIDANNITDDIYAIPYWPQGIYLSHAGYTSAHYTLETPSALPLQRRIDAHKSALLSAIENYQKHSRL